MSGENESKLVFDILTGNNTLDAALSKLLKQSAELKNNLKTAFDNQANGGVTLHGLKALGTLTEHLTAIKEGVSSINKVGLNVMGQTGSHDLKYLEAVLAAFGRVVSLQEKSASLSGKKLQMAAFNGLLSEEDVKSHAKNINALKALNKGYAQGGLQDTAQAKLGIKLVEEHTAALRKQNQEKIAGERQTAAEQRNRVITVAREIKEGKDHSKFIKNASALEANQLKLKLQNESLKAGLTADQQVRISTGLGATLNRLETLKAPKLTAPKELEFFNQLQGGSSKAKAQGTIALQEMAQHIRQLQKMGKADELLKWTETYQQSKSAFATKFAPISPHQEQLKESRRVAEAQKLPIAEVLKLTDKGDVAKQYRLSDIRAKALPEGDKKDAEIRYQDQIKAHGKQLRVEEVQKKKNADSEDKLFNEALAKKALRDRKDVEDKEKFNASEAAKEQKQRDQNIFQKARRGAVSTLDLKNFIADGSQDPKRLAGELKAIQKQTRAAQLDPTLAAHSERINFVASSLVHFIASNDAKMKAAEPRDQATKLKEGIRVQTNQVLKDTPFSQASLTTKATRGLRTKIEGEEYNKQLLAHKEKLSVASIMLAKNSAELLKATQAIQLHSKTYPKSSVANQELLLAVKARAKALVDTTEHDKALAAKKVLKHRLQQEYDRQAAVAKAQKVRDNELLYQRELAKTGAVGSTHIQSTTNKDILIAMGQGFKLKGHDRTASQPVRDQALAMQAEVTARLKTLSAKAPKPPKALDEVAKHAELNRLARNIELLDPKHANTSSELGTRSIEQKTKQLNKTKELEQVAANQYKTQASLANLSAEELTHAKKIINYRKNMAGANQQQADIELKLLSHIRSIEKATAEQARAAKKLQTHNERMATDAGYRLAQQQKANVAATEADRKALASTANDRVSLKARNEAQYRADIAARTYATPAAIQALSTPQQVYDARASLNYQASNSASKEEEGHARMLLQLLNEIHGKGKGILATNTLISDLEKTHYKTKESLNHLGREELQQAIAVLTYRRQIATTEQQRAAAQSLLNTANQAYKVNPEHQADNREAARTRILGDAGASVLTIQAGLMLNYKLLAGMQGLFGNALSSVIELDSAFRQLQAISASTNTEMVSMKQNLILVAQASKFSAAEVGNTAVLLAQAGFSIGEISQSMKGIVALAQATGTDLGKSVDVVTSVLSVFNKGAGETDQVVNQLTEALNRSKLDINKMALGIQYAGNIAADSGITFEELTASLGAMANAGIRSGSTLGTGLRQMFIDLQKPSEKLKEKLSSLGLSLDQVDLKSYGLIGVLENLKNAGFTTGDAFKTFEVRAASAFAALSGNMDDFNQLKEGLNDTTAAFDANGVQLEALAVQLDHLKSNLGILSAEALMPVAALVRDLAKATAHAMEKTEEGTGVLKGFGTVLAGITFGVAVGWMSKLGGELASMVWGLTKVKSGLLEARAAMAAHAAGTAILTGETLAATTAAASLRAVLWSMAPVVVGVVAAVGLVTLAWSSYGNEVEKLNEKLDKAKAAFNKAKESVNTAKTAYDNVNEAIDRLSDKYGVLKESQVATTTEAESLVTQFGAMGFALDDLANTKVEKLMEKLRELRGELSKEYTSKIGQELAAKVDALLAGKDAAKVGLEDKKFSPKALQNLTEGLTHPEVKIPLKSGYVRGETVTPVAAGDAGLRQRQGRNLAYQIKDLPTINLLAQYLREIVDVQKKGVPKGYNLPNKEFELEQVMANSKTLTVLQREKARDFFKDYIKTPVNAANQIQNFEPNKLKATQEAERKESRNKNEVAATDVNKAVGSSERAKLIFEEQSALLDATGNKLTLKARELAKGELGKKAVSIMKANLANVDKALEPMNAAAKILEGKGEAGGAPYFKLRTDIGNKEAEKAAINKAMQAPQDAIDKAKAQNDKSRLALLQKQLEAKKYELASTTKRFDKETGQAASDTLAASMRTQTGEVEALIEKIDTLKNEGKAEQAEIIAADADRYVYVLKDLATHIDEHNKDLAQALGKEATAQEVRKGQEQLKAYDQAHQDFKDEYELNNKLFDEEQKATQRRIQRQGKRLLDSGAMFKGLNKDLADRAQLAANNSGIPQEYAQYGQGIGGFFARQAAEAKSGVVVHQLKQKKLALDFINLQSIESRFKKDSANYDIPQVKTDLEKQRERQAQIDKDLLKPNTRQKEDLRTERQDLEASIQLKLSVLEQHKSLVKDYETERASLLADIENLRDDLTPIDENLMAFKNSFAAGRQALDAGLSAGFQDWATQTIKNIDDVEAAFKSMGLSILQSMLKVVSDRTAMAFTNMLLGKADGSTGLGWLGSLGSAFFNNASSAAAGAAGIGDGAISLGLASGGFVNGNSIPHFANGGATTGTDIGRDSIPAYLRPDEYVLRPSATAALGKPFLDRLNATTTGSLKQLEGKAQAPQVSVVQAPPTNVYVVSPDQRQQMGPQDVVISIEDNISRGGSIKRLIKSVISGEV